MNFSDFLLYEKDTGRLMWKVKRPGPKSQLGEEVGSAYGNGRYRTFVLSRKKYYSHRVIFEMVHGPIPDGFEVDHIDGNAYNNLISNLRIVCRADNAKNLKLQHRNRTGIPGIIFANNRYRVTIGADYLGYFDTLEEATRVRKQAEKRLNYHPNNGRNYHASS